MTNFRSHNFRRKTWAAISTFHYSRHHFCCGLYTYVLFCTFSCLLFTRYLISFYLFSATNVKQLVFKRAIALPWPTQFYGCLLKFYRIKCIANSGFYMAPQLNLFSGLARYSVRPFSFIYSPHIYSMKARFKIYHAFSGAARGGQLGICHPPWRFGKLQI